MRSLIDIQRIVIPDFLAVMQKRYNILRYIKLMQPVGRRNLAISLNLSERILRGEVEFFKNQQLIEVHSSGMRLSEGGNDLLIRLEGIMREVMGIDIMERTLKQKLGLDEVIIVTGNSDISPWVKSDLGKAGASRMKQEWNQDTVVAVTGGTTMAETAKMLSSVPKGKKLLFVPARGGLGEDVQNQANTIVSKMAEKANASHKVLYIPDQVSDVAYKSFMEEPTIKDVFLLIKSADLIVHSIGDALTMAKRRKTSPDIMNLLIKREAVAEAFGYYFNEAGEVVHKVQTVGIQLEDLSKARRIIAIAGGESKAIAIRAYMRQAPASTVLITDEAAANNVIEG